jgi:hypothetical protein
MGEPADAGNRVDHGDAHTGPQVSFQNQRLPMADMEIPRTDVMALHGWLDRLGLR